MLSTLYDHLMLYSCMLDISMRMLQHVSFIYAYVVVVRSDVPIYYSTDDLFGDLGCYAWGMARTHDGLMMLLMVGRNHALRLDVFYDGSYIFYVRWM